MERMKNGKRFVRYKEGAEMYSMCQSKFEQMAKDAKAIYKVDKLVLVNCDIFEQYLETFRLYVSQFWGLRDFAVKTLDFSYTESIMVDRSDWRCIQMAKMGRPKSDAPKLNTLSLRVTDSELRELKDYADSHGMTITQLLHTGVDLLLKTPDAEVQNLFP